VASQMVAYSIGPFEWVQNDSLSAARLSLISGAIQVASDRQTRPACNHPASQLTTIKNRLIGTGAWARPTDTYSSHSIWMTWQEVPRTARIDLVPAPAARLEH